MIAKTHIIIATRKSPLATWQAEFVKQALEKKYPELTVSLLSKTTEGDRNTTSSLSDVGGKDLFVKDLQQLVINGEADCAVHSLKDMSVNDHPKLTIAAYCKREDPRDAFLSLSRKKIDELPSGATVGTSSPRRECQLKALRPDLNVKLLRGNVQTRLNKLNAGEFDAIILAAIGLKRLGLENHITHYFETRILIPAIGQGIIAVECRRDEKTMQSLLKDLDDSKARIMATAERAVNRCLKGNCFTPIAAHATLDEKTIYLDAMVGTLDGKQILRDKIQGPQDSAEALGFTLGETLLKKGATALLGRGKGPAKSGGY